jgi:hypothetical protein
LRMLQFQTLYWMFNQNLIRLFHLLVLLVLREKFNPMCNNEKLPELERLNGDNRNYMIPLT